MLLVKYHCATMLLQNCVYHTRSLIKVAFFGDLFGVQRSGDVMQETMNLASLVSIQMWSAHPVFCLFIKRWQWRQHRLHNVDVEVADRKQNSITLALAMHNVDASQPKKKCRVFWKLALFCRSRPAQVNLEVTLVFFFSSPFSLYDSLH